MHLGRVRDIILLVCCTSCRKLLKIGGHAYQEESLGYDPYICTNMSKIQTNPQKAQCTIITHIQEAVENFKHSSILREFLIALHGK